MVEHMANQPDSVFWDSYMDTYFSKGTFPLPPKKEAKLIFRVISRRLSQSCRWFDSSVSQDVAMLFVQNFIQIKKKKTENTTKML